MLINYRQRKPLTVNNFHPFIPLCIEYKGVRYDKYFGRPRYAGASTSIRRAKTMIFTVKYDGLEINLLHIHSVVEGITTSTYATLSNITNDLAFYADNALERVIDDRVKEECGNVVQWSSFVETQWRMVKDVSQTWMLCQRNYDKIRQMVREVHSLVPFRYLHSDICHHCITD